MVKYFIKRILAVAGDELVIENGELKIDRQDEIIAGTLVCASGEII